MLFMKLSFAQPHRPGLSEQRYGVSESRGMVIKKVGEQKILMKNDSRVPRLCNRQRASKPRYFGYVLTSESGDKPQTSLLPKSSQIGFQWLIDVIVGKCAYEQWCIKTASNTFSSPIV